ncbi:MAG TPA: Rne/Rng family ribonuclease [Candidatus Brocadiia bacterium]|nr:Rne/Rng family ribonuclease [Candidatus Brocadiia bacterium]
MEKRMLVNVCEPEESRIAIVEDGQLEELYVERNLAEDLVGNVYRARVVNVERSLQAAFVDFGWRRQGFLHVSDLSPVWYSNGEGRERRRDRGEAPAIQDVLSKGQDLMVQVSKAGIRNKAPAVTTYVSLPGRYLVLMPQLSARLGVSRKIADDGERDRLRDALDQLEVPEGFGVIARTAADGRSKRELQRDLNYLARLYKSVEKKFKEAAGPALLYQESDLIIRAVRDVFATDIQEMWVDSEEDYQKILQFMRVTMPSYRDRVKLYRDDAKPLFQKFGIEEQIARIHHKRVPLPSGGSLVIEQTEALVAIDVNSGRFKREDNAEESAFQLNLEAAREIARQIRLRDMGGVIINDFVDMTDESHIRKVERTLWEALKRDRARTKMLRMSKFGIIEMTRQRIRKNIESTNYESCPLCGGAGQVLTAESAALSAFRRLMGMKLDKNVARVEVLAAPPVAEYLQNRKRKEIAALEQRAGARVEVRGAAGYAVDKVDVNCYNCEDERVA